MSLLACACGSKKNTKEHQINSLSHESPPINSNKNAPDEDHDVPLGGGEGARDMDYVDASEIRPDPAQYQLFAVIGRGHGNFSTISLAKNVATDALVAVKRINLEAWSGELKYLQNEIVSTRLMAHANILPFYCTFVNGLELWAVMPLMAFGSCRDLMHAYFTSGLPELAITLILREVLAALQYLHDMSIVHRGVKASHILISKSGRVCLSGLHNAQSTVVNGRLLKKIHDFPLHTGNCGHCYSPELLEQNLSGYSFKSDIYSVGILTCELANGQAPFSDLPATAMLLEKIKGTKPRLADSSTISEFVIDDEYTASDEMEEDTTSPQERANAIFFNRSFSPHLHSFADTCLEKDPLQRPTGAQLQNHAVFKSIKNKSTSVLPSLLQPVTPLTDIGKMPKDLTMEDEDDISRKMSEVSMLEDWVF